MKRKYRCGCGLWNGEQCNWVGHPSRMVVVEYMPPFLRESHRKAGNSGVYPHNGAVRVAVEKSCWHVLMIGNEDEWVRVLDDEPIERHAEVVED